MSDFWCAVQTWGLLTATILVMGWGASCEKDIRDSEKVDIIISYYVETFGGYFEDYRHSEAMTDDSLRKCAAHPYVRRIFITIPYDYGKEFEDSYFKYARIRMMCRELSGKMANSPKIWDAGTLDFIRFLFGKRLFFFCSRGFYG